MVSKVIEKLANNRIIDHLEKCGPFSDSQYGFRSSRSISYFLSNRWLQVVLDGKSSQEYPVNAGVPQGSILGPTLFLLYINDVPDVICNIAIYTDDAIIYSKYDQASNLW